MPSVALTIIQECLRTKDINLYLGNCGLTDADVAEGTEIDIALRQCTHLKTLILSNEWLELDKQKWVKRQNIDEKNFFSIPPPALSLLRNLSLLRCGGDTDKNWKIEDMSFVSNMSSLITLDLSNNQITELNGLGKLTNLQNFYIYGNKITELKGLDTLTTLQTFYIYDNQITELKGLDNLTNLQNFSIYNNQITELKGLDNLTSLQVFFIAENQITELKGLDNLISLHTFYIYSNRITELKGLDKLSALEAFSIHTNQITELKGLDKLSALQTFSIGKNQITELKGLDKLVNLQNFHIYSNKIRELKGLDKLTTLRSFYIYDNQITELKGLDKLSALQTFSISNNQITELKGLDKLTALQTFSISNNQITHLRPLIPFIQRENNPLQMVWKELNIINKGDITVKDNPIISPPSEIVKQGNTAILAWFEAHKDSFKEIKVLLIGDAEAGKTSLLRRLKEDNYKPDEEQTDGIIIETFKFKELATFQDIPILHDATAYFWDFGGQETMSATHQFFMTKRSVYLLLLEARKDNKADEQLRELMEQIEAFGGNSQVIVVVNKMDLHRGFSLDKKVLQKDYPQIKEILYVSCQDNENIDQVKRALATYIPLAELYDTEIDVRWIKIKAELQEKTNDGHYLSERQFIEICDKHELLNKQEQTSAITFLNDLGILLHFEKLDLKEYFVLEPYWVTTGVYQILTSPLAAIQKGEIGMEQLEFIINEEAGKEGAYCSAMQKNIRYYPNETRFIADIMTQFKLAYYTADRKNLLIPDLFENETPLDLTDTFTTAKDTLRFVYDYTYLPKSILPRFMVAMQIDIDIQKAWRTGAILQNKQRSDSSALIRVWEKQIFITVKGEHRQKREYLSVIRFFLDKINESLTLKPTLKIPLPGFEKYFAKYDVLLNMEKAHRDIYEDWEIVKTFPISQLLEGIERRDMIKTQGNTIINNYTIYVKGNQNNVGQGFKDSEMNIKSFSPETEIKIHEIHSTLDTLQSTLFDKIGIESSMIQAAINNSSTQHVKQMDKLLQEINSMSIETQAQLWDGFSLAAMKSNTIKAFVEKVEAERVAREIEDSANVKLKIGLPFMIKEILGVGIEYETTLADGKTFFEWFKKWNGIVV